MRPAKREVAVDTFDDIGDDDDAPGVARARFTSPDAGIYLADRRAFIAEVIERARLNAHESAAVSRMADGARAVDIGAELGRKPGTVRQDEARALAKIEAAGAAISGSSA